MRKTLLLFACLLPAMAMMAQTRIIRGKIANAETGEPLPGVSIVVKGQTGGSVSDATGAFSLTAPDKKEVVLAFSYTGFDDMTLAAPSDGQMDIKLKSNGRRLDEVVVVGYGTVRKRDLTGSVVALKGEEIVKVPASNAMEAIQGKVPGVDIVRNNGGAGSMVTVTVRGNRSIIAQNDPLYIVDGIQYNNFQDINPADIQSMDVLKDASSTAIYGSRGANGVVIITTKKGTAGKVTVSANSYYGVSQVVGYPKPMTGPQFADLKRQGYRTIGTWNSVADDPKIFTSAAELAAVDSTHTSTYWPGLLLNKGSQQDYGVGVSGGNDKTKVYFSFDYFKEKGVLVNDYSGRYTLRLNIDQAIANGLKVGMVNQLTYYDQNLRTDGILTVANKVIPYYTPYNADTLIKFPGNANQFNPLLEGLPGAYINKTNTTRILSMAYIEWRPVPGLSLRSNLGITNSSSRNGFFESANTIARSLSSGSLSSITNGRQTDLSWENIVTYQKKFGHHNLEITAISEYLSNRQDSSIVSGTGQLIAGQSFNALQNNPSNLSLYSNYIGSNLISGALRMNYAYKGKYLLTLTGRADGSSVLSPANRWSFFPSAAAAWRISDERFMADQHLFSDMKFRASYGVAGNAAVKPYSTQSGLILIPFSWNDQTVQAYGLSPQTGNPDLNWELTATADAGLDFSILRNRITATFDYYDSRTSKLLFARGLPPTSGVVKVVQNIGKTANKGIEIGLSTVNIQTRDLTWSSSVSFTANKERVVDLPNHQDDILDNLFIGHPTHAFYDYQKIGIWQTVDSALAKSYGYKPGDIRVADIDGSKTITAADRKVLGSAVPKYSIGFSNDVRFMNFDLNVYVFARVGQMFVSAYADKYEPNAIENGAQVNYWTPENPTNDYPRPNANISRAALPFATTLGYKDGSFVKIRDITLGYTFPAALTGKWHLSRLRWYASAKNYFTFSKVKDYDPEGSGSFELPLTKLIVTGFNVDF
jgi:TonB-linked SusC/RagA family outer membrane protein